MLSHIKVVVLLVCLGVCCAQGPTNPLDLSFYREGTCTFRNSFFPTGALVPVSPCLSCHCLNGRVQCRCDSSGCILPHGDAICLRVCGWL